MKKSVLCQGQIDKLVSVNRTEAQPTAYGVGFVDVDFCVYTGSSSFWQHRVWSNMLKRCFSTKYKGANSTYESVTCCDEWLSFATFLEWCNKEVGYSGKPSGLHLDKDLTIKGNKVYSPEACSFVPSAVNQLMINRTMNIGLYAVGVSFNTRQQGFSARVNSGGVRKYLGSYATPEDAFAAYKAEKEAHIKEVAMQYKGVLKPAVFESLISWSI